MKKLLFVNDTLFLGGVEKSLIEIINDVDFERYSVDLIIFDTVYEEIRAQLDKRINIISKTGDKSVSDTLLHRVMRRISKILPGRMGSFFLEIMYWLSYRRSIPYVKANEYHAAIAIKHDAPSLFVSKRYVKADKKIMYFRHGSINNPFICKKAYKSAQTIVAVSEGVKTMLEEKYPEYADKIIFVKDFTDDANIKRLSQEYRPEYPANKLVLCSCGRLSPEKGFDMAVLAAKYLKDRGLDFKWIFVGGGSERAALEAMVRSLGLSDEIAFTGEILNPFPHFKACDIYVQPSYVEAFGRTIAEAMVLCRPVVSTKTLGGISLIENEKNGILTEITADALGEGILKLASDENLRERIKAHLEEVDYSAVNNCISEMQKSLYE